MKILKSLFIFEILRALLFNIPITKFFISTKILKWLVIIVVIIITVPLIAALFIKKDYEVGREIVINKPKQEVFEYTKYLKNQNDFSKWASLDPHMQKTFTGTDGTPGFISAWESDSSDVGAGEQEIKAIKDGERIDYEIRFKKPFESTASAYMSFAPAGTDQTKVKWVFYGTMPYPMNLMTVIMNMDESIGNDLDTGLKNLKAIVEKK